MKYSERILLCVKTSGWGFAGFRHRKPAKLAAAPMATGTWMEACTQIQARWLFPGVYIESPEFWKLPYAPETIATIGNMDPHIDLVILS